MPFDVYLNVAVGGILTGLVYGLMALGLSVIFGVVRVVNFAHGEMMTIAMYHRGRAVLHLSSRSADHAGADRGGDVRVRLCAAGRPDQSVHHPAGAQPVPAAGGAGDHHRQTSADRVRAGRPHACRRRYAYDSFQIGPLIVDATKLYAGAAAIVVAAALFAFFRFTPDRQGDPRLRRQLHRRAGGRPQRQAALCAHLWRSARPASAPPAR